MAVTRGRPLSPHLQVYRPQITSVLSILHRFTGLALSVGALLFSYWVIAVASGAEAYANAQAFIGSWFGYLLMIAFSYALFYHLCNGIRHLFWDIGMGFELPTATRTGWLVVILSLGLTAAAWIVALAM